VECTVKLGPADQLETITREHDSRHQLPTDVVSQSMTVLNLDRARQLVAAWDHEPLSRVQDPCAKYRATHLQVPASVEELAVQRPISSRNYHGVVMWPSVCRRTP